MDVIANFFTSPFSQCSTAIDVSNVLLFIYLILIRVTISFHIATNFQFVAHTNMLFMILGAPTGLRQNSSKCLPFVSMFIADWISEI